MTSAPKWGRYSGYDPMTNMLGLVVFGMIVAGCIMYARQIITSKILDSYVGWMHEYPGKESVPICVFRNTSLQIKVQQALMKAAGVDAFVTLCCDIAVLLKS